MLRSKACSVLSGRIILGFVRQRERLRKLGLPIKRLLVPLYACGLPLDENVVETIVRQTDKASAAFIKGLMRRAAQFYIPNGSNGRLELGDLNAALEEMLLRWRVVECQTTWRCGSILGDRAVILTNANHRRDLELPVTQNLVVPLKKLNVVAGSNGSGKSSLYRSSAALPFCPPPF